MFTGDHNYILYFIMIGSSHRCGIGLSFRENIDIDHYVLYDNHGLFYALCPCFHCPQGQRAKLLDYIRGEWRLGLDDIVS